MSRPSPLGPNRVFLPLRILLLALLLPLAPGQANAQTTLKLTSRIVVLDVVVTDARGNPVPNLTQQDFTILEDGKPQAIRHFDPWSATTTSLATAQADPPQTLYVVDDLNTPFEEKSYAAFTLKRYLQSLPATLPNAATLLLVNDRGLVTLAPYTTQRDALVRALDHRPPSYPGQLAQSDTFNLLSETYAVLRQIALASEGTRAHKTLVWLGRGFPTPDTSDLDKPGSDALTGALRETVNLLTRARITMYKVDPIATNERMAPTDAATSIDLGSGTAGAGLSVAPTELPLAGDFSFNQFVVQTGGHYFYGRNDLDRQIADSLDRAAHFYTLTYVPQAALTPDAYQTLKVRMRDPSLTATTRTGFFDESTPKPEPSPRDIGYDLRLAANSTMAYSGVAVQVAAVTTTRAGDRATVNFSVADRTLTWTPQPDGNSSARVLAVLAALDANHKLQTSTTVSLSLAASPAQIASGHLTTQTTVPLDAKTQSLRLLIRDSSGRIGTADLNAPK